MQPDELIIGSNSPVIRGVNGFPETSINWRGDLRSFSERPIDALLTTPELIQEYEEEIFPYWEGHTLRDYCQGHMPNYIKEVVTDTDICDPKLNSPMVMDIVIQGMEQFGYVTDLEELKNVQKKSWKNTN